MNIKNILYNSGDVFLPTKLNTFLRSYIIGNNTSIFYINYWSIIHFINGIIFGFFIKKYLLDKNNTSITGNYFFKAFILHSTWELWQIFIENTDITSARGIIDTIMDTIFFMSGSLVTNFF